MSSSRASSTLFITFKKLPQCYTYIFCLLLLPGYYLVCPHQCWYLQHAQIGYNKLTYITEFSNFEKPKTQSKCLAVIWVMVNCLYKRPCFPSALLIYQHVPFFRLYRCSLIQYETDCLLLRSYESPVMLQRYPAKTLPQLDYHAKHLQKICFPRLLW